MKKLLTVICMILLMCGPASGAGNKINASLTVFNAAVTAASGTTTSAPINLDSAYKPDGFFSLQVTTSGSGTAKITYQLSNDGATYVTPTNAAGTAVDDIATALTAGNSFHGFSPPLAKWMRLVITETGTSNSVTVTAVLAVQ
jgi:hypothetical protein